MARRSIDCRAAVSWELQPGGRARARAQPARKHCAERAEDEVEDDEEQLSPFFRAVSEEEDEEQQWRPARLQKCWREARAFA